MPHAFPLLHSSLTKTTYPALIKWVRALLRDLSKILDTYVVDLKHCLLDPRPGWCRPGMALPKSRFSAGKKPLTAAELKWFTVAGIQGCSTQKGVCTHWMVCLPSAIQGAIPTGSYSLATLPFSEWILPHVPNLHHYKRTGNSWDFYYPCNPKSHSGDIGLSAKQAPSQCTARTRPGVPVGKLVSQGTHWGYGVAREVRGRRYVLHTACQRSDRLLHCWCYGCICGWSVPGWLESRLPHE